MAVDADVPGMYIGDSLWHEQWCLSTNLHILRLSLTWVTAADFDLLGELDLVPAGALQSAEGPNAQPDTPRQQQQQQQQQSVPAVKQQRPTIRLPSLAINATKAAPASLNSCRTMPDGYQPLLSRDLNGDSSCRGSGVTADAKQMPPCMQQTAQRGAGFIAPRRQTASERPVHRLQTATFPHAQQSSSVLQNEITNRLSGASGADCRGIHTPAAARRQSSSNSGDTRHAAGTGAVPQRTAAVAAPPSGLTPLQAPEQRRQSGTSWTRTNVIHSLHTDSVMHFQPVFILIFSPQDDDTAALLQAPAQSRSGAAPAASGP
jgi:hypothetical protein